MLISWRGSTCREGPPGWGDVPTPLGTERSRSHRKDLPGAKLPKVSWNLPWSPCIQFPAGKNKLLAKAFL